MRIKDLYRRAADYFWDMVNQARPVDALDPANIEKVVAEAQEGQRRIEANITGIDPSLTPAYPDAMITGSVQNPTYIVMGRGEHEVCTLADFPTRP